MQIMYNQGITFYFGLRGRFLMKQTNNDNKNNANAFHMSYKNL